MLPKQRWGLERLLFYTMDRVKIKISLDRVKLQFLKPWLFDLIMPFWSLLMFVTRIIKLLSSVLFERSRVNI